MATTGDVRALLEPTTLPAALIEKLLSAAPVAWLLGESAEALAGDLALCHPPLAEGEVRASVQARSASGCSRLTVVAHDRPGMLAATAGVLAGRGVMITNTSVASWPVLGLALQCMTVTSNTGEGIPWDAIGPDLRAAVGGSTRAEPDFEPAGPIRVSCTDQEPGLCVVTIEAPDQVGLLWAVADWFAAHGCNIEAVTMVSERGQATGSLLVSGEVDTAKLAGDLGGEPIVPWALPSTALKVTSRVVLAGAGVAAGLAIRSLRGGRKPG